MDRIMRSRAWLLLAAVVGLLTVSAAAQDKRDSETAGDDPAPETAVKKDAPPLTPAESRARIIERARKKAADSQPVWITSFKGKSQVKKILMRGTVEKASEDEDGDVTAVRLRLRDEVCKILPDRKGLELARFIGRTVIVSGTQEQLAKGVKVITVKKYELVPDDGKGTPDPKKDTPPEPLKPRPAAHDPRDPDRPMRHLPAPRPAPQEAPKER